MRSNRIWLVSRTYVRRRQQYSEQMFVGQDDREQPNAVIVTPGPRSWEVFAGLCRLADVRGNLVADAYLAALAIDAV